MAPLAVQRGCKPSSRANTFEVELHVMGILVLGNEHAPHSACTTMTPQDYENLRKYRESTAQSTCEAQS